MEPQIAIRTIDDIDKMEPPIKIISGINGIPKTRITRLLIINPAPAISTLIRKKKNLKTIIDVKNRNNPIINIVNICHS